MNIKNIFDKIRKTFINKATKEELYDELIKRENQNTYIYDYRFKQQNDTLLENKLQDIRNKDAFNIVLRRIMERCKHYEGDERIKVLQSFRKLIFKDMTYSYLSDNENRYCPTLPYYDDKELYKHLETDGANWISVYDKSVVGKCYDFRIALIFKLRQEELSN